MQPETRHRSPGFFGDEARSASSVAAVPLHRFLHPRYWRAWALIGWLRLAALLPWRLSLTLHKRLGRALGRRSRRAARTVADNLARCFPELSAAERAALESEYFANMGAIVSELATAWFGTKESLETLCELQDIEHLERALERGRGVILCAGHFTPIEICSACVGQRIPRYSLMFNQRRNRLLSEVQRRGRSRFADESFDKRDIRGVLRSLRDNAVLWYSGDEAHTGKSAALLPFFGQPALTNTSLSRLVRISGAAVVPLFYCRKPDDTGYRIRFEPALEGFPSDDTIGDTKRLLRILEGHIRECPAQYFWKQQRFRRRRHEAPAQGTSI